MKRLQTVKMQVGIRELGDDLISSPVSHPKRDAELTGGITPAYLSGINPNNSGLSNSEIEPEIKELALSLKTPANTYFYIKNNISYEPY